MVVLLGEKDRFAARIGERAGPDLRQVDLWAAGQWLTCDDNTVYVPQFKAAVARSAEWVRSGCAEPVPFAGLSPESAHRRLLAKIRNMEDDVWQFRPFTDWGPTTDNVLSFVFSAGTDLLLTFEFWREQHLREHPGHAGRVLVAALPAGELAAILGELAAALGQDHGGS
jgi:hypothetical protein